MKENGIVWLDGLLALILNKEKNVSKRKLRSEMTEEDFAHKENIILRKNVYDLEIQLREARKRISELLATKDG